MIKQRQIKIYPMGGTTRTKSSFMKSIKGKNITTSGWIFEEPADINPNVTEQSAPIIEPIVPYRISTIGDIPLENVSVINKAYEQYTGDINDFKERIYTVESKTSGGYDAYNKHTGATGKYQFLPKYFRNEVARLFGVSWSEFAKSPELQERLMNYHINTLLKPTAKELMNKFPNSGLNEAQLMALVHFKGKGGAIKELSNPALMNKTTDINISSVKYLSHFR